VLEIIFLNVSFVLCVVVDMCWKWVEVVASYNNVINYCSTWANLTLIISFQILSFFWKRYIIRSKVLETLFVICRTFMKIGHHLSNVQEMVFFAMAKKINIVQSHHLATIATKTQEPSQFQWRNKRDFYYHSCNIYCFLELLF
jgi:hypothetical protein